MPFAKANPCSLGCITLLLAAAALSAAQAATLETKTCSLIVTNGVVVGLSNRLCGETLVLSSGPETGWSALHRLNQGDLRVEQAKRLSMSNAPTRIEWTAEWAQAGAGAADRMRIWVESEPGTGDILVQQEGQMTTNGLVGVSWGIASVPDSVEVLVPGCSGQRFGADAPAQRRVFDYPMMGRSCISRADQGRREGGGVTTTLRRLRTSCST